MKTIKKKVVLIIVLICCISVLSALVDILIRATYIYPYVVTDDCFIVNYYNEEYISVESIPDYINQDIDGILEKGKFESQSVIEKAFISKTLIDVFRYDTEDTVYLKVVVQPNHLISFGEVEQQVYYFQKV